MLPERTVHIVLTRFNVKSRGKESKIRLQPNWLNDRFELFEAYCLPSIKGQSLSNFKWLIYFDSHTPEDYKTRIEQYCKDLPLLTPFYIDEWNTENVQNAIRNIIPSDAEYILTTRLDNDDGIHSNFFEVLHNQDFDKTDWYYNFPNGLTYSDGIAYAHTDTSNAFLSRFERVDSFQTAWQLPHPEVEQTGRLTQIDLSFAWLQVIHGLNVSNKVRGRAINPEIWLPGYISLKKLGPKPLGFFFRLKDLFLYSLLRQARDTFITVVKKIIGKK